jgi:hypothetical protein
LKGVLASTGLVLAALVTAMPLARAQRPASFHGSPEAPAIRYSSTTPSNAIEQLNARLDAGAARIEFRGRAGYLRSALQAIGLPVDSQLLVFSDASFQARRISETNPRAIFFKDDVALGWVRDGEVIEVAAQDDRLGTVFYTLQQKETAAPRFKRAMVCLGCHLTGGTLDVPGLVLFSSSPRGGRPFASVIYMNQTTPIAERFGGWFVTGARLPAEHLGNAVAALSGSSRALTSTGSLYPSDGYLANTSDVVALLVFAHQAQTVNLLILAGWEARVNEPDSAAATARDTSAAVLRRAARDLADSLLFIDEARLDAPIRGSSGFAERFSAEGPRDRKGRSLRQLDLTRRLMRYPCSYLINSPMFDRLPEHMKTLVYERLWQILSGAEHGPRYRSALTFDDRRAIVEILRGTKQGLPSYFAGRVTE